MSKFLPLFLLAFCGLANASDELSVLTVRDDMVGAASLSYYNYDPKILAVFEEKQLQGGGYTWEALIKAVFNGASPNGTEFDPEGDAFYAYASSAADLEGVKEAIERLRDDPKFLEECMLRAGQGGYLE